MAFPIVTMPNLEEQKGLDLVTGFFEDGANAECLPEEEQNAIAAFVEWGKAILASVKDDPGCRCEVCGGRNDDPAGIHGRRE